MIERTYNETISVKRFGKGVTGYKQTLSDHIASLPCLIYPADPSMTSDIAGGYGKEFIMVCATADIQEGDRLFRTLNAVVKEYRITSIKKYDFIGHDFMEVGIRIFES